MFGHRINNSGFSSGMYWFYVLPLGFLLTMYTITGYDASAHLSEETHDAAMSAPKGVWRSVFYSARVGWIVLLALMFAATHQGDRRRAAAPRSAIIETALSSRLRQGRDPDLDRRPAVLRHRLRDERLADDVRVLARRRGPGPQALAAARRQPHADVGGPVRRRAWRSSSRSRRTSPTRPAPGRVLRGHLDLGDRPLHRLHDPGVPALARWATASSPVRGRSATSTSGST